MEFSSGILEKLPAKKPSGGTPEEICGGTIEKKPCGRTLGGAFEGTPRRAFQRHTKEISRRTSELEKLPEELL